MDDTWDTGQDSEVARVEPPGGRFRDRLDNKVADWVEPFRPGQPFDIALLGAPLSKTSISHSAAFRLPDAVRAQFAAFTPYSVHHNLDLSERLRLVDIGNVHMHLTDLPACQQAIEEASASYWRRYDQPLVLLGGDHSVTGCSVLGLAAGRQAAGRQGKIGIVHFDAHHDVRNLEDGGRHNGTPFRTILESGAVDGRHIVQLGLKDFANSKPYFEYVQSHGVTVFSAREIHRRGLLPLVEQAFTIASQDTDGVYVSFDMDGLDQSFVPGVPAPSTGGLNVWDAIEAVEWLGRQPQVIAMDTVCVDPERDFRDLTVRVVTTLVLNFLTGIALRQH